MICRSVISYLIDFKILFSSVSESYRNGDIRLVEGRYNWEGRVEIYVSKTWSTINDSSWTNLMLESFVDNWDIQFQQKV